MTTSTLPRLSAQGIELDLSPEKFGWLEDSSALLDDPAALRAFVDREGYLFVRDFFDREEVLEARRTLLQSLADEGKLQDGVDLMEGRVKPNQGLAFRPDLAQGNAELHRVVYGERAMGFWDSFFGEPALHFDFTWLRAVGPGSGTPFHCDIVYMGRGTRELFTMWTPLGDVDLETGGLMILERSHRHDRLNENYGRKDVDAFCENRSPEERRANRAGHARAGNIRDGGWLSRDAVRLQQALGGRWLTCEDFRAGDLLIFPVFSVHGSLDNHTDRVRLSSDTRYQRASQPADERWIGPNPPAHGPNAKRGMIC
jgi:hypothetical protein